MLVSRLFEPGNEYKDKAKKPYKCETILMFTLGVFVGGVIMQFIGVVL